MNTFKATLTVEIEVDGDLAAFDHDRWFERYTDGDNICEFGDEDDGAVSFVRGATLDSIVHADAAKSCKCPVCRPAKEEQ